MREIILLILYRWVDWSPKGEALWPSHMSFSWSVMSDSLRHHGLQHSRLPCPSPSSGVCSNSCLLSRSHELITKLGPDSRIPASWVIGFPSGSSQVIQDGNTWPLWGLSPLNFGACCPSSASWLHSTEAGPLELWYERLNPERRKLAMFWSSHICVEVLFSVDH